MMQATTFDMKTAAPKIKAPARAMGRTAATAIKSPGPVIAPMMAIVTTEKMKNSIAMPKATMIAVLRQLAKKSDISFFLPKRHSHIAQPKLFYNFKLHIATNLKI
jgi:hypothetical protein